MPEWFLPTLVALALITVFGHLIWLALAWLVRKLSGASPQRPADERQQCPFCERSTPRHLERCDWCGRHLGTRVAAELADLALLERQLKRLQAAGVLEQAQVDEVLSRVEGHRRRLLEPPPPAAAPVTTTHVPPQPAAETARPPVAREAPEPPETAEIITAEVVDLSAEGKPVTGVRAPAPAAAPGVPPPTGVGQEALTGPRAPAPPKREPPVAPRPSPAPAPKPPRRSWKEALAAFLEERNIRWAELVLLAAGLLIVGPSIALVISFWEALEQIPVFKFLIFVAVTSGVFGIGLYAHYRWRLASTGRAMLLIATLLVPLNFWAMASLSKENWTLLNVAWELASLGVFVYLVGAAGKVLAPGARWFQAGAILGNSAVVLLVARLAGIDSHGGAYVAVGSVPVAVFAAAVGGFLYRTRESKELDPGRAGALFTLLGTAAFALLVAIGLLVARGVEGCGLSATLHRSAVLLTLAAFPILAAGLTVVRGTARDVSLGAQHTAGTMIALVGILMMLAALAMAWPQPLAVLAVGTASAAALAFVAFRYRLPVAHGGAIACAAVVYLTGYHVLAGHLELLASGTSSWPMIRLAAGAESAVAMVGLVVCLGMAAGLLARSGYGRHAEQYAGGCVVVTLVSLLTVTARGLLGGSDDARQAMAVYAIYAATSLLLNAWMRKRLLSYFGLGLLVGATIWALWWRAGIAEGEWAAILAAVRAHWAAILAAEALVMGIAAAVLRRLGGDESGVAGDVSQRGSGRDTLVDAYRIPLMYVAELVAMAALVVGAWTAWRDRAAIHWDLVPVATAACTAALYLLLAWGHRSVERTWVGSMVALAGLVHALRWNYEGWLEQPMLDAVLAHATVAVLASILLDVWVQRGLRRRLAEPIRLVFVKPLGESALVSSALALVVLAVTSWQDTLSLSVCLFWLAAIWLAVAWTHRWPAMLAASQAVLTAAVAMATTAWLQHHPWGLAAKADLLDPRSLQVYGIGLGLLTLAWIGARIALRRNAVAQGLLNPAWPAVDRIVGHAVVALQLLLVAVHLLPGCWQELIKGPAGPAAAGPASEAFGATAWLLVGVLALGLLAALWHRWGKAELAGSLLVAVSVACLVAGPFAGDRATASGLRWGLALCWIVGAAAVWQRQRLHDACKRLGAVIDVGPGGPRIGRAVLLAVAVAPVLLFTVLAALLQMGGIAPGGPAPGSFFHRIGPELSYLVPLVLVMAGLVGFALRETSAGYAFSGGLVAKLTVALGYLLSLVQGGKAIGTGELVALVQLVSITAAGWAVAWLVARRKVDVWREGARLGPARTLMSVQLGMGVAGNTLLWVPALFALVFYPASWHDWTIAAGSGLGWASLLSVVGAVVYRQMQAGRPVRPDVVGMVGMAALGLLACTIRGVPQLDPEWGYRTLMLGWAAYALFVALVTWWVATIRTLPDAKGPPQALIRAAAAWVSAAGLSAVLLGLKAALLHDQPEDLLWAAGAIAVASAAGAAMAVWRRREGWAFAAALGVNLAASLAVWYYAYTLSFAEWWILLVEANVIASASVALLWLAARKRLYKLGELTVRSSPLLGVQTALAVAGSLMVLLPAVVRLAIAPDAVPDWVTQVAAPSGWIALLLAAGAAAWYLRQISPGQIVHALAGLGLGAGVLCACGSSNWHGLMARDAWLPYHVLMTAWATIALALLGLGWMGRKLRLGEETSPTGAAGQPAFPRDLVAGWVTVIGSLAVALALLWCVRDPGRPWWSVAALLGVSLTAGFLAVWLRRAWYLVVSGALIHAAGTVALIALSDSPLAGFAPMNVLCLAVASILCSVISFARPGVLPSLRLGSREIPFAHVAAEAALVLLGAWATVLVLFDLTAVVHVPVDWLGWSALAAAAAAVFVCVWDVRARFPLPGLYLVALSGLGMALDARALAPRELCWTAGPELAGFALLAALAGLLVPRVRPVWRSLLIPDPQGRWAGRWLPQFQAAVVGAAAVLSVWISLDVGFDPMSRAGFAWLAGRMVGPLSAAALLLTSAAMAGRSKGRLRGGWQYATLALGMLVLAESGWAGLPATQANGLHQCVILMVASTLIILVAGFGLARLLPQESDWITRARRLVPWLGGLAVAMLLVVLVQEILLAEPEHGVQMAMWAVVIVAAALAGLIVAGLAFAVTPRLDPLGLSLRGRTAYVYAAEVLAALIGLHVRLTMPWLFRLGIMERYWMLLVMVVAFVGAGLSELFHRRRMRVLSEPLERTAVLLPLAPAIGFWFAPQTSHALGLAGGSPAIWFLAALFYGFLATTRRSVIFGALSVLAGNAGLWVLWHRLGWGFLEHPQIWLIPVALTALVAEYLNRDRLTRSQSAGLRYLALSVVYVSSTTEFLVIHKIGESLVLPLVVILLSLAGILSGIVLRIRSYVHLGVTFLLLAIVTMIWHATVDQRQTWVLYLSCIALGLGIFAVFALYEKHRDRILAGLAQYRQWEP